MNSLTHPTIITVSELNRNARQLLEQRFPLSWISGEISNFTRATSGHWYFSLKDENAQVRCAMFRMKNQYLDWVPQNGWQVEVRAQITLFESKGEFQLVIENIQRSGLGALYEAFDKLKQRLTNEGLFHAAVKKPIPRYPTHIGIVTSLQAAGLKDVLATLARRMPGVAIILYPTPVQGEGCGLKIAAAIESAARHAQCQVIILCRGGGSIEDLWGFNEECVARAIFACSIPIVSGVGHETDFTIADFVADLRAPTPTAAAEMCVPHRGELLLGLSSMQQRLTRRLQSRFHQENQKLDFLARRLTHPGERLRQRGLKIQAIAQQLNTSMAQYFKNANQRINLLSSRFTARAPTLTAWSLQQRRLRERLENAINADIKRAQANLTRYHSNIAHLNPQSVLERGFSIVTHDQKIVRNSEQIQAGGELEIQFAQGHASAVVKKR